MDDFFNIVIPSVVLLGLALLTLWASLARRTDQRLAQLEAQEQLDVQHIVKQFWKHETVIQQNAATTAAAQREIMQLATHFARTQSAADPMGQTIATTVHTQKTIIP